MEKVKKKGSFKQLVRSLIEIEEGRKNSKILKSVVQELEKELEKMQGCGGATSTSGVDSESFQVEAYREGIERALAVIEEKTAA